ncbi:HDIG domain-containing metalloprotein [Candidatus Solincola tengchongensis]|uniref:HD family phosphohydrolase n=1 Tax=Candidatus Solincola tengchongensis TaxID=2900693 RepID=UPI00257DB20C|nr:HDIG domain-containing metalloprotein [Candidatus Solincola tengchongensis]
MEDKEGSRRSRRGRKAGFPASGKARSLLVSLTTLFILLAVLVLEYLPRPARFEVGKPSTETVISPRDFEVLDEEGTEALREQERRKVQDIFVNRAALDRALARLEAFFSRVAELRGGERTGTEGTAALRQEFGVGISDATLNLILNASPEDSRLLHSSVSQLLSQAMSRPVSYDNLESVKAEAADKAMSLSLLEEFRRAAADLTSAFLAINTAYSAETVQRDMEEAARAVPPVYVHYVAGQKIVGKGEIITPLILASLREVGALSPMGSYQQVVGVALMALLLYAGAAWFFLRYREAMLAEWRTVAALCLLFLAYVFLSRLFALFADQNPLWGYLVPSALVGLTMAAMLDNLTALFTGVLAGVLGGILLKGNFPLAAYVLLSGVAGALAVTRLRKKEMLLKAGVGISLFLAVGAMLTASLFKELRLVFLSGAIGLGNGALCMLLALGAIPVMERISGVFTPMHMMELASPDHPLMKLLINKAPGTYSHSIVVGNLAEAAAQAIGADAILTRVASYYHDVGKVKRSSFFVENQPEGFNGHDGLKPNLSALVITAHVREGVELAREYRLPPEVVDIIHQHHGTSLVRYFYAQALKDKGPTERVVETRFRYPGRKPQTKEAAVVMLADAVEAAAKALERPTPVQLEQLVRNMIRERLDDGQLDESGLTLADLERITREFTRVLCGMYHVRVEYPALVKREGA